MTNMIELTPKLNEAIGEIPYKYAMPLVIEINRQIQEAMKPQPEPPKD